MTPPFIGKEQVATLLPMQECIGVMESTFRALAKGECLQPLRSIMWLPDKTGLLGMMPGYAAGPGVMGIKLITVFHANKDSGYPSHQGIVALFDAKYGQPLMLFDATEITAIRTAAVSALATRLLSRENSERLAIIGAGEQAQRHVESIMLVRKIKEITIWNRNEANAEGLAKKISAGRSIDLKVTKTTQQAAEDADIICTVTASRQPLVMGKWISKGSHINAVGSSTPFSRELDTTAIVRGRLFTDRYESIFKEAGDFLIPKEEGIITDDHVKAELGEVLSGTKKGRESDEQITIFKSLGLAVEDIYSAWHIYQKINGAHQGK
jgi:ornithine cyclodeaminase/alanine dehydrogenase-like protein (mu-crystallin family)